MMQNPLEDKSRWTLSGGKPFHGDPGHSCYDGDGNITCAIAKAMLSDGPTWRDLT